MKQQLFVLDRDMLAAMAPSEVLATYKDMHELGIASPPFPDLTIQVPCGAIIYVNGKGNFDAIADSSPNDWQAQELRDAPVRFEYTDCNPEKGEAGIKLEIRGRWVDLLEFALTLPEPEPFWLSAQALAGELIRLLVVSLATRNVERVTKQNRLAKFGIGKDKNFTYVTTLRIGKITISEGESSPTGETRRPHLRRGHIRNQHYGPKNQYSKRVWIEPIFVNGFSDADNAHRERYNVRASA